MASFLIALASLAVAAAALVVALRTPAPAAAPPSSSPVEERLAELQWTLGSLSRRLAQLEAEVPGDAAAGAPADTSTSPRGDPSRMADDLAQLRKDVSALLAGEALSNEDGRTRLRDMVREVQDEVMDERLQRRLESRRVARRERLQRFVDDSDLGARQAAELTALLDGEEAERRRLFDSLRTGGSPGETFEAMRKLRTETDAAAAELLDGEQLAAYEKMRQEERQDWGGGPMLFGPDRPPPP